MKKQTRMLLTLIGFLALGVLGSEPVASFEQYNDCQDCYPFELPLPDGTTQSCTTCLSLPASTAMGCITVFTCGCVPIWPGQCHNC